MKKKIIIFAILSLLPVLAVAYRFFQLLPYPMGGGKYVESPDKRFTARASSLTDRDFFCGERRYYEFIIDLNPSQRIRRIVIPEPKEGMIGWRDEGTIQWATDGSSVTYTFKETQLTLKMTP